MNKSKIILKAEAELEDTLARVMIEKIMVKLETLNDRTKQHTRDIQELRREIKKLK